MNEQVKKDILKLVEESRDVIVCSVTENGYPNAKSMFKAKQEGLKTFWFSTNVSAARTGQWLKKPNACIYFLDSENIHGLMLTGQMKVYMDNETKQAFWKPGDERYYPLGPTDPDYCMLKFTATEGNYWGQQKYLFNVDSVEE
ncbi:pyridoxamine 5'-phosphate oxidase family protein [Anaerocolumna sedimenticola]|uniref:Pyridoxamine 5'-phosphate oxidase family protein n=1 Tax=Anaerocolumna sedimenticola TaxID=2696063 RepID=A0A6P1TK04_9FIRM|nr:pyridoxamine 5'-phosphate oxidase family protein [Anaerocolumna sedimenticola]QHQ60763.1 pyridoxamine 5'-phosphate oxidase family protein [Anaerocolumna sedimenticola]